MTQGAPFDVGRCLRADHRGTAAVVGEALITGRALLTRDTRRYQTLLPTLTLISPERRTSGT